MYKLHTLLIVLMLVLPGVYIYVAINDYKRTHVRITVIIKTRARNPMNLTLHTVQYMGCTFPTYCTLQYVTQQKIKDNLYR
jgi:uncharacterized protein (UPF0333 family)